MPGGRSIKQVVELAPVDVLEELLKRLVEHRAAPDDGGILLDEESDRHHADAVVRGQRDQLAVGVHARALGSEAQHPRLRVAPHVRVEHAHLLAVGRQSRREIGGHARLADAALARADADDVAHLGERALGQRAASELAPQRRLLVVGEDVEADVDADDALDAADGLGHAGLEVVANRAARGGQRDHDIDHAVFVDVDRADHLELDDVAAELGVDNGA